MAELSELLELVEDLTDEAEFFSPNIPTRPIRAALSEVDCRHIDRVSGLLAEAAATIARLEGERDALALLAADRAEIMGQIALERDAALEVLEDAAAYIRGDIGGTSQRDGILKAASRAIGGGE